MPAHFRERIAAADALVHPQDDRERDLLDGDGVADFAGGFAAAAALLGQDTGALSPRYQPSPSEPKARTLAEEVARVVRGRLTNPRWISGMLLHGHRGVAEIAQGVDAVYAFAATAEVVPAPLFDLTHAALIADEAVLAQMLEHNPAATGAIAARLQMRWHAAMGFAEKLSCPRTRWRNDTEQARHRVRRLHNDVVRKRRA